MTGADIRAEYIAAGVLVPAPVDGPPHVPSLVAAARAERGVVRFELDWRARRHIRRELANLWP